MWFYKRKGFTLLELMIVVIIIAILVSIALPRFITAVSRARWSAAASILGTIRSAQLRYYAEHNIYTGIMTDLDTDFAVSTTSWTINDIATVGSTQVGNITNGATSIIYSIDEDGVITPAQP